MILVGKNDCVSDQLGTTLKGCIPIMDQILKFILLERGTKFNIQTDTLDMDKVKELIQSGKMIVLPDQLALENNSEETVYETLGSGVMLFVRQGLYQLLVHYAASVCFSKAANQLSSKKWDLLMVDASNKLYNERTPDGYIKGFELSLNQGENIAFNDGSTSSKKPVRFQLSPSGTNAFNERIEYFSSDIIDWVSLEGVEDVYLEVISKTSTLLQLKVVNGCDKSTNIEGLDDVKFWRFINASTKTDVSPSSISYLNGIYTFKGISAGDYLISLYDQTKGYPIINVGTNFLKTSRNTALAVTT